MVLVKYGVPWDVAWSMSDDWRLATLVTVGEIEGNEFSWDTLRWLEKTDG